MTWPRTSNVQYRVALHHHLIEILYSTRERGRTMTKVSKIGRGNELQGITKIHK
jgi:hypothetical protein